MGIEFLGFSGGEFIIARWDVFLYVLGLASGFVAGAATSEYLRK